MSCRSSRPLMPDLAEAAEHFAHWRRTRPTSSAPTPSPLRKRAIALLAAHRPSAVADALGIDSVMLGRRSTPPLPTEPSGTASPFVTLPEMAPEPARAGTGRPGHEAEEQARRLPIHRLEADLVDDHQRRGEGLQSYRLISIPIAPSSTALVGRIQISPDR